MPPSPASTTLIGFDSAWAGNARTPGAICAVTIDAGGVTRFDPPELVGFDAAAAFVEARHEAHRRTLLAIDQPTIVTNLIGMRPCEKVVASVASWSGGGIQPANRGKTAMFGDCAPIWRFLNRLGFVDDPRAASSATSGGFVMEVFPALALLAFDPAFAAQRGAGPRYNPDRRKTFRQDHWSYVCQAVASFAERLELPEVAEWCHRLDTATRPRKPEQDKLDAVICLLVAANWLRDRERCVMVGDCKNGYIVAPVVSAVRARLAEAAKTRNVQIT